MLLYRKLLLMAFGTTLVCWHKKKVIQKVSCLQTIVLESEENSTYS